MAFWLRSSSLSADNLSASCLCRCVSCTRISCGQENRFLQVCKKMVWIWINPVAFYTPFNGLRPSPSAKTSQLRHWVRLHTGLVLRWVLGVLCMGLATVQNKTSSHSGTWPLQLTSIYLIPSHPISSLLRSSLSVYLSLTVHFSAFLPIVHPFSSDFSGPSGSPGLAVAPRVGARSGPSMAPSDTWTPTWWLLQDQSRACRNHVEVMSKLWIKKASNHLQPKVSWIWMQFVGWGMKQWRLACWLRSRSPQLPWCASLNRLKTSNGGRSWSHRPGFRQGPKVQGHLTSQRPYGGWHWWSVKA